ncbi:TPA: DUF1496 domain-containing protein [Escherichia coli]|nr:DUF1496 domain-containing protein [Salmonella enterica subsp. enterica serovar Kentucky]KSY81630.1 hypothetical protein APU13_15965 [Escherichia coli]HBD2328428.1 DUF1496 domain-containing protein [Escherichia coli]HEA1882899.1 DUF1496 domain-containing protein [Escherichia coli]
MITVFFNGESKMKLTSNIVLFVTAAVFSCSAFSQAVSVSKAGEQLGNIAQAVTAPETDSLLKHIFEQQLQTNSLLLQIANDQASGVTLTPAQKKTSCLNENKYYSSGALLTVGSEKLRCTLSGEIPTWENANEGNIVSVEGK